MKHLPNLLYLLVCISILTCIWLLFIPSLVPEVVRDQPGIRIGLAQVWVGLASVFSLLIAGLQLKHAQRTAKLKVWLFCNDDEYQTQDQSGNISIDRACINDGVLGYLFCFTIGLENIGNAPAKFVEMQVEIDPCSEFILFRRDAIDRCPGKWIPEKAGTEKKIHMFIGGLDFICYHHFSPKAPGDTFVKKIGDFSVFIPKNSVELDQIPKIFKLTCKAHSDGEAAPPHIFDLVIQT